MEAKGKREKAFTIKITHRAGQAEIQARMAAAPGKHRPKRAARSPLKNTLDTAHSVSRLVNGPTRETEWK